MGTFIDFSSKVCENRLQPGFFSSSQLLITQDKNGFNGGVFDSIMMPIHHAKGLLTLDFARKKKERQK